MIVLSIDLGLFVGRLKNCYLSITILDCCFGISHDKVVGFNYWLYTYWK